MVEVVVGAVGRSDEGDGALVEVERAMVLAVSDLRRDGGSNSRTDARKPRPLPFCVQNWIFGKRGWKKKIKAVRFTTDCFLDKYTKN